MPCEQHFNTDGDFYQLCQIDQTHKCAQILWYVSKSVLCQIVSKVLRDAYTSVSHCKNEKLSSAFIYILLLYSLT